MLRELENQYAISGFEDGMRAYLTQKLRPYCDEIREDNLGNLHAVSRGTGLKFLVLTYMDEPGVIVTKVTEEGYLHFETVGRIRPEFLVSKKVKIGNNIGIISLKAIHLTTKKEREIPVKTNQLLIDIGAVSKEDALNRIQVGDYGVLDIPFRELNNGFIKGRSLAGRMGCYAAIKLIQECRNCNIHVVFAAQREVGHRGVLACAKQLNGDVTMILEDISARTYLEEDEKKPQAGKGVVVSQCECGIYDARLLNYCDSAAKQGIKIQYESTKAAGTAALLPLERKNRLLSLAFPVRYPESTSPVASTYDLENAIRLMKFIVEQVVAEEKL